jgi:uncharacterized protein (TIGR02996 family)
MPEIELFLAAIAAAPDDDVTRLVFADWLEERGDPLGEFIRLQIELEPLRQPRSDLFAEFERVRLLDKIPPGADYPDRDSPLARKLDRETDLLRQHQAKWLGTLAGLDRDYTTHFQPEFRRGFIASVGIGLSALLDKSTTLRQSCPALQHLIVFGTLGRGKALATCPSLAGLPELTLAGWLTATDASALAQSPNLASLQSLTFWIGALGDEKACRTLAWLPSLREMTLVQMWGGWATDDPEGLDRRADELAALVNRERRQTVARVERPFARRFPLDGVHVGYGVDAGYLPGGRTVLVAEGARPFLIHFDDNGVFVREEQLDLRDKLVKKPKYSWQGCDEQELIEVLGRDVGFRPGPIFVREFWANLAEVGITWWGLHEEVLAQPDDLTDPAEVEDVCRSLHWWKSTGQFSLPFGNIYWADGTGRIHSS